MSGAIIAAVATVVSVTGKAFGDPGGTSSYTSGSAASNPMVGQGILSKQGMTTPLGVGRGLPTASSTATQKRIGPNTLYQVGDVAGSVASIAGVGSGLGGAGSTGSTGSTMTMPSQANLSPNTMNLLGAPGQSTTTFTGVVA
jgi:hypothetical protein